MPSNRTVTTSQHGADRLDVLVVIVSYKTASLTVQAIRSLETEIPSPGIRIRVAVVDNDSGDYCEIAEAIERNSWSSWVTLVKAPRNGGFGYGNNLGIRSGYGVSAPDYIYLLNPDAQVRPGAVSILVKFLQENPRAGIAGSRIGNSDGSDWSIAFRFPGMLSEFESGLEVGVVSRLLRGYSVARRMGPAPQRTDWICGASMMIRPAVIAKIGGFDESYFLYFEETDFCFRAKQAGFETWYVPGSQVVHIRGHSTKVTDLSLGPRRLPEYWFDSRRRFFVRTYGVWHAMAIDAAALVGCSLGLLKRKIVGRGNPGIPCFIRDLLRNSVLLPRNRTVAPLRTFLPQTWTTDRGQAIAVGDCSPRMESQP